MIQNYYNLKYSKEEIKLKSTKKLKAITLILVIILITILSFLGVYNVASVHGDNLVKDYNVGMELKNKKLVRLKVDDTVNEVFYDAEGKKQEKQNDEGTYTSVQEPVNPQEVLNKENYKKALSIVEKRLNSMEAEEYKLRFNEENGAIELELMDNDLTNYILESIRVPGDFKIVDADTKEVLMDASSVKKAGVLYSSANSASTTVYLDIEFNKEGSKKLEELSKTYIKTTENVVNEEGKSEDKTVEKKITVQIDDTSIISTSFGEPLTSGHLYISVGQGTTNNEELRNYALQASIYAAIIENGTVPVVYTIEQNKVIVSNMNKDIIPIVSIVVLVIEAIVLIVVFRVKGIIASILQIGYVSLLLLILKYTNVYISIEGLFAIVLVGLLNMAFIYRIMYLIKKGENVLKSVNENIVKFINVGVPVLIVAIIFCFAKLLEINSFGMVIFWGYVVSLLYNIVFTKIILKNVLDK